MEKQNTKVSYIKAFQTEGFNNQLELIPFVFKDGRDAKRTPDTIIRNQLICYSSMNALLGKKFDDSASIINFLNDYGCTKEAKIDPYPTKSIILYPNRMLDAVNGTIIGIKQRALLEKKCDGFLIAFIDQNDQYIVLDIQIFNESYFGFRYNLPINNFVPRSIVNSVKRSDTEINEPEKIPFYEIHAIFDPSNIFDQSKYQKFISDNAHVFTEGAKALEANITVADAYNKITYLDLLNGELGESKVLYGISNININLQKSGRFNTIMVYQQVQDKKKLITYIPVPDSTVYINAAEKAKVVPFMLISVPAIKAVKFTNKTSEETGDSTND